MRYFDLFESELPMDQASRMERAKQMGFTVPAYHGTDQSFNEFDMAKSTSVSVSAGHGFFFADKSSEASGYSAKTPAGKKKEGGNVIPVLLKVTKPFMCDLNSDDRQHRDNSRMIIDMARDNSIRSKDHENVDWFAPEGREIKKKGWQVVYDFLKSKGYDAIYFPNTPSDYKHNTKYTRIVIFDPRQIRSIFATFDPAKSNSADLNA